LKAMPTLYNITYYISIGALNIIYNISIGALNTILTQVQAANRRLKTPSLCPHVSYPAIYSLTCPIQVQSATES